MYSMLYLFFFQKKNQKTLKKSRYKIGTGFLRKTKDLRLTNQNQARRFFRPELFYNVVFNCHSGRSVAQCRNLKKRHIGRCRDATFFYWYIGVTPYRVSPLMHDLNSALHNVLRHPAPKEDLLSARQSVRVSRLLKIRVNKEPWLRLWYRYPIWSHTFVKRR